MQVPYNKIFLISLSCPCIIAVTYFTYTWDYTLYIYICNYNIYTLYICTYYVYTYIRVCIYIYIYSLVIILNCYMLDQQRIIKIKAFILSSIILFSNALPFLCRSWFLIYVIFLLCEELLLYGRLLATYSFNFCSSEKGFISPSLLQDNFTGYRILGWWVFSLNI